MASFADFQYCIYADLTPLLGRWMVWWVRSEKVQNFADVIYGWSTFTAYDLLWILNISAARVVKFIMPSTATVEYMGNLGITLC